MASVRQSSLSPYWIADLRIWKAAEGHPQNGYWCKTTRSTGIPSNYSKEDAQRAANEMERIGRELQTERKIDRTTFEKRLEGLMRTAGVEVPRKKTTWRKFSDQFLDECDAGTSSLTKYRGEIGQFKDFLGARAGHDLRDITHQDVSSFFKKLQNEGRSSNTARNTTKTVRGVLQKAHLLGYIESNPAALLRLKTSGVDSSREPFTRDEVKKILEVVDGERRIAILFGLTYGLRAGDASRRCFEEIEKRDGVRCISFIPEKKNRSGKAVTLPLVGELASLPNKKTGYITPSIAELRHPGRWFETVMRHAHIERKRKEAKGAKGRATNSKTFHSLRHTISSWLMDSGADQRMRQLVCDHDDPKMNARYTHGNIMAMSEAIMRALQK